MGLQERDRSPGRLGTPLVMEVVLLKPTTAELKMLSAIRRNNSTELQALRERLLRENVAGEMGALQVTSAGRSEGKTTIAACIAIMMAELGKKTLLVDVNFYSPRIRNVFSMKNPFGLFDVLKGDKHWRECLARVDSPPFDVLHMGDTAAIADPLRFSEALREFIKDAEKEFDLLVLDGGAISASIVPPFVGAIVDTSIVVVQANRTRRKAVEHCIRLLRDSQVSILGTVLNRREYYIPDWIYRRL